MVAGESGNVFYSYVKIHYSIPKRVRQITGIMNRTIKSLGVPFRTVMGGLVEFLQHEQCETPAIIIAHGGYLHDFPILLANCMKHNCDKFGILLQCMFVDNMQILQNGGYKTSGLDALCEKLNIKRNPHSALEDAYILKTVCNKKSEMFDHPNQYTFGDITYRLKQKLPLPIREVYSLAAECASYQELGCILYKYVNTKSALNLKQVCKIAYWYFKEGFIYCKWGLFS